MNLYIMRHGEANWDAKIDSERSLTSIGEQQAITIGEYLNRADITFDLAVVSPYKRAQQTANNVLKQFPSVKRIESTDITPESPIFIAQESLDALGETNVLLISHLPLVASLTGYLTAADVASDGQCWTPATIAYLTGDNFLPGCMKVQWIKSPSELADNL
ncbi:MAG: phosphohistidine phosphatase [Porticoccus sp.]|jgi:phosphohistidine phosphatase